MWKTPKKIMLKLSESCIKIKEVAEGDWGHLGISTRIENNQIIIYSP